MDRDTDPGSYTDGLLDEPSYGSRSSGACPAVTEAQVADYLERNPDFFLDRPQLLQGMTPPARWDNGAVVDLQRHWVDVLKGEIDGLRACASSVIETSRENLATQMRMHAAVLGLLDAPDLDAILDLVSDDLPPLFQVDMACIGLEDAAGAPEDVAVLPAGFVDRVLGEGGVTLSGDLTDDGTLFGAACGVIRSAALVRLDVGAGRRPGLLAFGCCAPDAFSPRQGTELLNFLGQVVSWRLSQQLSNA